MSAGSINTANSANPPLKHITFPADLPISRERAQISQALLKHQVIIVAGETGSGKTTQLPKIALSIGRKSIAHTQPRRIAARAVAERIAEELQTPLGQLVGYQVRFTDISSKNTQIKLLTDGILLNAIHHDRLLRKYDTIIIDEAHERSLNIDFLLGYLRTLLPQRPDLKVIITSATIDPQSFAQHFADAQGAPAPVIEVSGRSYPVEVRYRPLREAHSVDPASVSESAVTTQGDSAPPVERDLYEAVGDAAVELLRDTAGDVLAFFAGEGEIRDAAEALKGRFQNGKQLLSGGQQLEVLPLYGRLSAADQHRVFTPPPAGYRRIVLATNVAETSLTVPGITGVIDTGAARISRYSKRSKVQRLPIEAVSQASATQRAGRAGRTSCGVAVRLYSEEDFVSRPLFTDPEILRTGLASVLLQMLSLELGEVKKFPFLTPPDAHGVRDGLALLAELGAVKNGKITALGKLLAQIPLEPRFGRMLIESLRYNCSDRIIALVAGLTVADVRETPAENLAAATHLHQRFADPLGDLHTLLNLYDYLRKQQAELGSSAFRRLLKSEFINVLRVREWFDLVTQLQRTVRDLRLPRQLPKPHPKAPKATADLVTYCALSGLLSQLGVRDEKSLAAAKFQAKTSQKRSTKPRVTYLGSRGTKFMLHPSSVLAKKQPETVMCVELVETSRLFGRVATQLNPAWAEFLAADLAKSSFSDPHWSKNTGAAVVLERVTLFGVPIIAGRKTALKRFDAQLARQIFITEALVNGNWHQRFKFFSDNAKLRASVAEMAQQSRLPELLDDTDAVYDFYNARIPQGVANTSDFVAWWQKMSKSEPLLLHLSREDLVRRSQYTAETTNTADFPSVWHLGDQILNLSYRFEPGALDDGLTVLVPLPLLPRLRAHDFVQLVPGMQHELVAALLKSLPKPIRKHVIPANQWAHTLLQKIMPEVQAGASVELKNIPGGSNGNNAGDSAADSFSGLPSEANSLLLVLLAQEIRKLVSLPVLPQDFDLAKLPAHLRPTFRVLNAQGGTVAQGKDLNQLQKQLAKQVTTRIQQAVAKQLPQVEFEQAELVSWPQIPADISSDNTIPQQFNTAFKQPDGMSGIIRVYPCLQDNRSSVALKLLPDADSAQAYHRLGVRRLVALSTPPITAYVQEQLTNVEKLALTHTAYRALHDLVSDAILALAAQSVLDVEASGLVYTEKVFKQITADFERRVLHDTFEVVSLTAEIALLARQASKAINSANSITVLPLVQDAKTQLNNLLFVSPKGSGFISRAGVKQLRRFPVYLRALILRMEQLLANPGRDRALLNDVAAATTKFVKAGGAFPLPETAPTKLHQVRWQLEELRVSLFAQQLGASEKVSLQRISKTLAG